MIKQLKRKKIETDKKEKLHTEYVILISGRFSYQALENYKIRWEIETMFKAFKTHGFNIENTHIKEIDRIKKLVALVGMAFCWCYLIGIFQQQQGKKIAILKHGRPQYSCFYFGLLLINTVILNNDYQTIKVYAKVLSYT